MVKDNKLKMTNIIAETIISQIRALDRMALMVWGATNLTSHENSLFFKVRGLKMKGTVKITLDEDSDTYILTFYKGLANPKKIKEITDVYCDQLVYLIDGVIEK